MTLTLKSRKVGKLTFIETEILGATVTLSQKLTNQLKEEKALKQQIETDDRMILVATNKISNGKTFTNLYLTLKKSAEEKTGSEETSDELPF